MKSKILTFLSVLCLLESSVIVYQNSDRIINFLYSDTKSADAAHAEAVNVFSIYKTDFVGCISTYGKIKAANYSVIKLPYISGFSVVVNRINFKAGDFVKKGDVIARFKCEELEFRLKVLYSEFQQASIYYNKIAKLKSGSVSEYEIKKAQLTMEKSEAELNALKVKYDGLEVKAPFDGKIGASEVVEGDEVSSNGTLSTIVGNDKHVVTFYIDNREADIVYKNKQIMVESMSGDKFSSASVVGVAPYLDDEASRLKVTANLTGKSKSVFIHNSSVTVSIDKTPVKNVYTIPRGALIEVGNTYRVCKAVKRGYLTETKIVKVVLVGIRGDKCAVNTDELQEGDYVIVEGGANKDGISVNIKNIYY